MNIEVPWLTAVPGDVIEVQRSISDQLCVEIDDCILVQKVVDGKVMTAMLRLTYLYNDWAHFVVVTNDHYIKTW